MAMLTGQCATDPVTGLAGRIFTKWVANSNNGFGTTNPASLTANARACIAAMCESIAAAVIEEIQANARTVGENEQIT